MILPESTIEAIRRPPRLRTLRLPVARPARKQVGARREWKQRPPLRSGETYVLKAAWGYAYHRAKANQHPQRKRAVLWLIDRCEQTAPSVRVTVTNVLRDGSHYLVKFDVDKTGKLGDTLNADEPLYLARGRNYTTRYDELGAGEVMLPFGEDLERARQQAREKRLSPEAQRVAALREGVETHQQVMSSMKARVLLKRAQRNLQAAEKILAEECVDSTVSAAADGTPGEGDRPPRGASEPSLRAA